MDIHEVIEFANQHSACWLATSEDGAPHVRGMWLWFADEQGLVFHTGSTKDLAAQLRKNPRVEVAFHDPAGGGGESRMLRVAGTVEFVNDASLQQRLFEERAWLHGVRAAFPDVAVQIFRVKRCVAHFWSMSVNCREREQPRVEFG